MHLGKINWIKSFLAPFLLALPLIAFVLFFTSGLHDALIKDATFTIQPEFTNDILSAYGIIIGFWAAIVGLSYKEHRMLLYARDFVQFIFFVSLSLLMLCVFLFALQAINVVPSYVALLVSVTGFYLTCIFLGLTLNTIVFNTKLNEKD